MPLPAFFSPEMVGSSVKIGRLYGNFLFGHTHSISGLGLVLAGCLALSTPCLHASHEKDGMMAELPGRILGKIKFVNVCSMPGMYLTRGVSCSCCPEGLLLPAFGCSGKHSKGHIVAHTLRTQPPAVCACRGPFGVKVPRIPALGGPVALAFLPWGWGGLWLGKRSVNKWCCFGNRIGDIASLEQRGLSHSPSTLEKAFI